MIKQFLNKKTKKYFFKKASGTTDNIILQDAKQHGLTIYGMRSVEVTSEIKKW